MGHLNLEAKATVNLLRAQVLGLTQVEVGPCMVPCVGSGTIQLAHMGMIVSAGTSVSRVPRTASWVKSTRHHPMIVQVQSLSLQIELVRILLLYIN